MLLPEIRWFSVEREEMHDKHQNGSNFCNSCVQVQVPVRGAVEIVRVMERMHQVGKECIVTGCELNFWWEKRKR